MTGFGHQSRPSAAASLQRQLLGAGPDRRRRRRSLRGLRRAACTSLAESMLETPNRMSANPHPAPPAPACLEPQRLGMRAESVPLPWTPLRAAGDPEIKFTPRGAAEKNSARPVAGRTTARATGRRRPGRSRGRPGEGERDRTRCKSPERERQRETERASERERKR